MNPVLPGLTKSYKPVHSCLALVNRLEEEFVRAHEALLSEQVRRLSLRQES
jgi:hypothetical protein